MTNRTFRALPIALAATLALSLPAHAEPITTGLTILGGWYATIGVTGQLLVQLGASLALSVASYGLAYMLGGAGKRQHQARQEAPGTPLPEFDALLEARIAYGTVTTDGGVFVG